MKHFCNQSSSALSAIFKFLCEPSQKGLFFVCLQLQNQTSMSLSENVKISCDFCCNISTWNKSDRPEILLPDFFNSFIGHLADFYEAEA
jgi:hypothetical protein